MSNQLNIPAQAVANRPIHDALREFLSEIDISFGPTLPSFKRDRFKTATGRERSIAEFLESYLPMDWSVKKGPIYDNYGGVSAEVDCTVCVPQHPPCRTPNRDVILAEGVQSAVEVKPDIRSLTTGGEFARSLHQAMTVKRLQRQVAYFSKQPNWPKEAYRIPYVVFAREMSDLEKTADFMNDQKTANGWTPWDLPDMVVGYKDGILYHAAEASICSIAPQFKIGNYPSGEGYLIFDSGSETLILFLGLLFGFLCPQTQVNDMILKDYIWPLKVRGEIKLLGVKP